MNASALQTRAAMCIPEPAKVMTDLMTRHRESTRRPALCTQHGSSWLAYRHPKLSLPRLHGCPTRKAAAKPKQAAKPGSSPVNMEGADDESEPLLEHARRVQATSSRVLTLSFLARIAWPIGLGCAHAALMRVESALTFPYLRTL